METIRASLPAALPAVVLGLALVPCACRTPAADEGTAGVVAAGATLPGPPAVIVGTVLHAATRRPVAGARISGPSGVEAVSGREGRFELRGLTVGSHGELVATTEDGRSGRLVFRPLRGGELEVVVFLR